MVQGTFKLGVVTVVVLGVVALGWAIVLVSSGSDKADQVRPVPVESFSTTTGSDPQEAVPETMVEARVFDVLRESLRQNRYTILHFYDSGRSGARETLRKGAAIADDLPYRAAWVEIDIKDPAARPLLEKYQVRVEPLTLVLAPNAAVAMGFRGRVSGEQLERAVVSPKTAEILKAIQEDKLVFLAFVGPALAESDVVRRATQQAAVQMVGISRTIEVDPTDAAEKQLLAQCGVSPDIKVAETLVISPRGAAIRRFKGAITSQHLYDSFQSLLAQESGCGSEPVTGGSACQPGRGATGQSTCSE